MSEELSDAIWDLFDDLFHEGTFELADRIIACMECATSIEDRLIVLTVTLAAKSKLPSRAEYLRHTQQMLNERCDPEAKTLLRGLE